MGSGKTYLAASVQQVREQGDDRVIFKPLGRSERGPYYDRRKTAIASKMQSSGVVSTRINNATAVTM
jgi:hypothetical protein